MKMETNILMNLNRPANNSLNGRGFYSHFLGESANFRFSLTADLPNQNYLPRPVLKNLILQLS